MLLIQQNIKINNGNINFKEFFKNRYHYEKIPKILRLEYLFGLKQFEEFI